MSCMGMHAFQRARNWYVLHVVLDTYASRARRGTSPGRGRGGRAQQPSQQNGMIMTKGPHSQIKKTPPVRKLMTTTRIQKTEQQTHQPVPFTDFPVFCLGETQRHHAKPQTILHTCAHRVGLGCMAIVSGRACVSQGPKQAHDDDDDVGGTQRHDCSRHGSQGFAHFGVHIAAIRIAGSAGGSVHAGPRVACTRRALGVRARAFTLGRRGAHYRRGTVVVIAAAAAATCAPSPAPPSVSNHRRC